MNSEPVTITQALNAALIATFNVIAIVASIDATTAAAVNIALGAWVLVIGFFLRQKVTPIVTPLEPDAEGLPD